MPDVRADNDADDRSAVVESSANASTDSEAIQPIAHPDPSSHPSVPVDVLR